MSAHNTRGKKNTLPPELMTQDPSDEEFEIQDEFDEDDEDDDLPPRAKPKARSARAKSTGRHRAVKKAKTTEDPDAIADDSTASYQWSAAATSRLVHFTRQSIESFGGVRQAVIWQQLKAEGFTPSQKQVSNKIKNGHIVELIEEEDAKSRVEVARKKNPKNTTASVLNHVFEKMKEQAYEQAAYSASRKGSTHLQSALSLGADPITLAVVQNSDAETSSPHAPLTHSPNRSASPPPNSRPGSPVSPIRPATRAIPLPDVADLTIVECPFSERVGQVIACVDLEWNLSLIVLPPPGSVVSFSYVRKNGVYVIRVGTKSGAMDIYEALPDSVQDKIPIDHFGVTFQLPGPETSTTFEVPYLPYCWGPSRHGQVPDYRPAQNKLPPTSVYWMQENIKPQ